MQSLKVNHQTNLQDLQNLFAGQKDNAKIYGKREGNDLVLYVQPQRKGLLNLVDKLKSLGQERSGVAEQRRSLARLGINAVVDRFADQALQQRSGDGDVHGQLAGLLDGLRSHLQGPNGVTVLANKVGRAKETLNLMTIAAEKSTLVPVKPKLDVDHIIANLSQPPITAKGGEPQIKHISAHGRSVATPIEIDGKTYAPSKHLASGGFGDVYLYRHEQSGHEIAFKISSSDSVIEGKETPLQLASKQRKLQSAAKEIQTHANITGTSGDHVIKLVGACRMQDGSIGIATELAPHGSVAEVASNVRGRIAPNQDQIGPGQLSKAEGRLVMLTLLHDMAKGLHSLHKDSNVTHFDFKSPNILVDNEGLGKIADFGTSYEGGDISFTQTESIEAAAYKAPELCFIQKGHETKVTNTVAKDRTELKQQLATFYDQDVTAFNDLVDTLTTPLKGTLEDSLSPQLTETKQMDVWGYGASALELFSGQGVLATSNLRFEDKKENELAKFHQSNENAIRPPSQDDVKNGVPLSGGTGEPVIDNFLNAILRPKPEDRLSIEDIMNHELFKGNGVGSPEIRQLIQALGSKDDQKIDLARTGLQWVN